MATIDELRRDAEPIMQEMGVDEQEAIFILLIRRGIIPGDVMTDEDEARLAAYLEESEDAE